MKLSLIIPAKDKNDPKLLDLIKSIEAQDFPKSEMEILVITEGTSESAKAIGIHQATGEVIGFLASDNFLPHKDCLKSIMNDFPVVDAAYPMRYHWEPKDDVLNRYFSLIGGNDPLAYYMGKNDRYSHLENVDGLDHFDRIYKFKQLGTIGDNGFFIKKSLIEATDLENYYHIDNAVEALSDTRLRLGVAPWGIWHRTGGNIFKFFAKRYRYGLQHAFNKNRRWHLVDFRQPKDILRLLWFILATISLIEPLCLSIRGWLKVKDMAWFLHPIVCLMTIFTYGLLIVHMLVRRLSQSLFAPMAARTA